jgi:hypothetical protein
VNTVVRIIKHEAVANCGSFEVHFSDGAPGQYFSIQRLTAYLRTMRHKPMQIPPEVPCRFFKDLRASVEERLYGSEKSKKGKDE